MVKSGWHVTDAVGFFGVLRRVVFKWLEVYAEEGQTGLLAKTGAGCKPKLSAEQLSWLAKLVRDNTNFRHE